MTIREAKKIYHDFEMNQNPSEDDFFVYTEAMSYLIEKTGEAEYANQKYNEYLNRRREED